MTLRQRLSSRLGRIRRALSPSDNAWQGARASLWLLVGLIALAVLLTDIVPDFSLGKLAGFLTAVLALLLVGVVIRLLLWCLSLLHRRYRASLFLLLPLLLLLLLPGAGPKGTGIVAAALVVIFALIGGGAAVLRREAFQPRRQKVTLAGVGIGLTLGAIGLVLLVRQGEPPNPALVDFELEDRTLDLPDPGASGNHRVETLTYGTGDDLRRPEYGGEVDLLSRSVDGSKLIDNWEGPGGWIRTRYWGFDDTELPLQGRVWYPDGPGPFPLVLIVHGNHGMEDFSDPGYAYLGELLASRGFITVSVDENFLNSSFADLTDMLGPGLDEENDARGWLLLEHLALWSEWNSEPGHPFEGKVAIDRMALIGHSRGGEAVAVAAAFNRLDRYPDDATLAFDYGFDLRGIIAIAPADRQYEPRERPTPLHDVNYFVIHGSLDGDVTSFAGSSQYSRIELTRDPTADDPHFKSALYVVGANHGQFNTSWGRNDMGGFWGWALDTRPIMDPEQQRRIAKVYFSAFLETVLHDNPAYLPIFSDARNAAAWLPDTPYLLNYADSRELVVADFDDDLDPATTTLEGGRIEGTHLTKWREEWISLKWNSLDTHVAIVGWDDEAEPETASFAVKLPPGTVVTGPESVLFFSLSAADEDPLPDDRKEEEEETGSDGDDEEDEEEDSEPLDWSIVLTDASGESAGQRLAHDRLLYPQIEGPTRRASWLEFLGTSEVVFHRYSLKLADFVAANPALDSGAIREVRFVFDASPRGVVILDDLGFAGVGPRDDAVAQSALE